MGLGIGHQDRKCSVGGSGVLSLEGRGWMTCGWGWSGLGWMRGTLRKGSWEHSLKLGLTYLQAGRGAHPG